MMTAISTTAPTNPGIGATQEDVPKLVIAATFVTWGDPGMVRVKV